MGREAYPRHDEECERVLEMTGEASLAAGELRVRSSKLEDGTFVPVLPMEWLARAWALMIGVRLAAADGRRRP